MDWRGNVGTRIYTFKPGLVSLRRNFQLSSRTNQGRPPYWFFVPPVPIALRCDSPPTAGLTPPPLHFPSLFLPICVASSSSSPSLLWNLSDRKQGQRGHPIIMLIHAGMTSTRGAQSGIHVCQLCGTLSEIKAHAGRGGGGGGRMGGGGGSYECNVGRWRCCCVHKMRESPSNLFAIERGALKICLQQVDYTVCVAAVSLPCGMPSLLCAGINNPCRPALVERQQSSEGLRKRMSGLRVGMGIDPPGRDWLTAQGSREGAHKSRRKNKEIFGRSCSICVIHEEARVHCMLWHCPCLFCCW